MALEPGRVHLGDCLELMQQIETGSIDMIFTDPPYGHNNNNNGDLIHNREKALGVPKTAASEARPIFNDSPEDAERVFKGFLKETARILVPGGCCCCCCCGGGPDPQFARWSLWMDEHIPFKMAVVWDKGGLGMGWHYRRNYEFVLVASKGSPCKWYDKTDKIANVLRIGKILPSADQHPTEKPVSLAEHFIKLHTQPGEIVLDPFAGSGSTLVAAQRLRRRWLGMELDEHWQKRAEARAISTTRQRRLDGW